MKNIFETIKSALSNKHNKNKPVLILANEREPVLVKTTREEAFKFLMDKKNAPKVFYKENEEYLLAKHRYWHFGLDGAIFGKNFLETDFYYEKISD